MAVGAVRLRVERPRGLSGLVNDAGPFPVDLRSYQSLRRGGLARRGSGTRK